MQKMVPYKQAIGLKYPEHVVLVLTVDQAGKVNVITLGWSMVCSHEPPMLAVSVGRTRYTHEILDSREEFVLAFPGLDMADQALYCGTHSGREVDKLAACALKTAPAHKVKLPLLTDAVANFECRVVSRLLTGDHTIFVGQVLAAHVNTNPPQRLYTLGPDYELGFPGQGPSGAA